MTAHTPGPWNLLRGGIEVQSESNNHEVHAFVNGIPVPIAEVYRNMTVEHDDPVGTYEISEAEGLANAALIAAAPDLLNALRAVSAALEWHEDRMPKGQDSGAIDLARAAIEQAEGRS